MEPKLTNKRKWNNYCRKLGKSLNPEQLKTWEDIYHAQGGQPSDNDPFLNYIHLMKGNKRKTIAIKTNQNSKKTVAPKQNNSTEVLK